MSPDLDARAGKTLVLGIGNDLLADDGVGIHCVRRVAELLPPELAATVDVEEAAAGGFELVDYLQGYGRAVIVDAIKTKGGEPGAVYRFAAAALKPTAHLGHSHGVNLAGALAVLDALGLGGPAAVTIIAVEADEVTTFSEEMTPAVAAAVEDAANAVLRSLEDARR